MQRSATFWKVLKSELEITPRHRAVTASALPPPMAALTAIVHASINSWGGLIGYDDAARYKVSLCTHTDTEPPQQQNVPQPLLSRTTSPS